jgi:hypothetical protein
VTKARNNEHGVRRQAGAKEIAITPEMVEAGEFALSCCGSEELALAPLETTSRYAVEVFEAMARAGGYHTTVVKSQRHIPRDA